MCAGAVASIDQMTDFYTEIFAVPPTHRAPTSDGGTVISYVLPGATVAIQYLLR